MICKLLFSLHVFLTHLLILFSSQENWSYRCYVFSSSELRYFDGEQFPCWVCFVIKNVNVLVGRNRLFFFRPMISLYFLCVENCSSRYLLMKLVLLHKLELIDTVEIWREKLQTEAGDDLVQNLKPFHLNYLAIFIQVCIQDPLHFVKLVGLVLLHLF